MFGDLDYDPAMDYASVPLEEQVAAVTRAVEVGNRLRLQCGVAPWVGAMRHGLADAASLLQGGRKQSRGSRLQTCLSNGSACAFDELLWWCAAGGKGAALGAEQ